MEEGTQKLGRKMIEKKSRKDMLYHLTMFIKDVDPWVLIQIYRILHPKAHVSYDMNTEMYTVTKKEKDVYEEST